MIKDISEYKKKKKILIKHNKYYYDHNASKIDDASYDKLKIELLNFEKNSIIPANEIKVSELRNNFERGVGDI